MDYFLARYHSSAQGRFTSTDPYNIVMETQVATNRKEAEKQFVTYLSNPQRWNRYTYALDNPLLYTDPNGEDVTIYYRPADPNGSSYRDQGHIFIYVRNDETGASAYFDYYPDEETGETILGNVFQERIDGHHSITIERTPDQEQAILDGIKSMQQGPPNFDAPDPLHGHHVFGGESTCVSNSVRLLSFGGIQVDARTPKGVWDKAFQEYGNSSMGNITYRPKVGPLRTSDPPYPGPGAPGKEYGRDPRGKSREFDNNAKNNQKLVFRDGKRVN